MFLLLFLFGALAFGLAFLMLVYGPSQYEAPVKPPPAAAVRAPVAPPPAAPPETPEDERAPQSPDAGKLD